MPPCNCGKTASGAAIVYQWHDPAEGVKTFTSETDAQIARSRGSGRGSIIRTTQPAK